MKQRIAELQSLMNEGGLVESAELLGSLAPKLTGTYQTSGEKRKQREEAGAPQSEES